MDRPKEFLYIIAMHGVPDSQYMTAAQVLLPSCTSAQSCNDIRNLCLASFLVHPRPLELSNLQVQEPKICALKVVQTFPGY